MHSTLFSKLPLGSALAGKLCFRLKRATWEAELPGTFVPKQELGNKLLSSDLCGIILPWSKILRVAMRAS